MRKRGRRNPTVARHPPRVTRIALATVAAHHERRSKRPDASNGTELALPDGGREELGTVDDPAETRFVWGQTTDDDGDGGDADRSARTDLDDIEASLDALAETADRLTLLATNADLKLARDESEDLGSIVTDVESEASAIRRAVDGVETRLDSLRERLDEQRIASSPASPTGETDDEDRRTTPGGQRVGGRPSAQLPAGGRYPDGPWRAAGVDLTNWPGHLATVNYDQLRDRMTPTDAAATGRVPSEVAEFSLDERELPFDVLLSLASAGEGGATERDAPDAGDAPRRDEENHQR